MKSKISSLFTAGAFGLLIPVLAFAQGNIFDNLLGLTQRVLKGLFPVITAVLILLLAYQIILFLKDDAGDEKKALHKSGIIKAVVALFIWFTFFGIITVVAGGLGVNVGEDVTTQDITTVTF